MTNIFVNLPVQDLPRSIAFFTALGYTFNSQFTDATATCMVIDEKIHAMLLTHEKFMQFAPHPISDANATTEVLVCLSCESRDAVKAIVAKAVAAGAKTHKPAMDYGFMYGHGFQDPDGHCWEYMWMDMAALPKKA